MEIAVRVDDLRRGFGIVVITGSHGRTLDQDFAIIIDAHIDAGDRATDSADLIVDVWEAGDGGSGLGEAIAHEHVNADGVEELAY